ncbi:MAG: CoA pyrophosphatase [Xanthomonadaceae bacterium]|jgi:8-oxo-dGTP pyrophosphatase MutT (NUDIX family)|nr:CoA pyrophosphatase [Xanthomonadaceae bacterium]
MVAVGDLRAVLHAPARVPDGPPRNLPELADLLPAAPLRPAAVLVGLREHRCGPRVLLTRRQDALRHHAGQISFPGGRVDAGDSGPLAAALRETIEEVGLPPAAIEPLGWLDPYATLTGFHVFPLVAALDPSAVLEPNPDEVAEAFEVPLDFLLDPANALPVTLEWRGRERRLVEFHWGGHRIWGTTAAMLVDLRDRLRHGG